jgi:hypothetical protein
MFPNIHNELLLLSQNQQSNNEGCFGWRRSDEFIVNAEKGTGICGKWGIDRLLLPGVQRTFLQLHLLSEGRSVRVQCSLPSLYINLNVHLNWHSDV